MINKKALFILPHYDFHDDEYFKMKELLEAAGVKTEVCSTHMSEAQGRFKNIVEPMFTINDAEARDYDVFIFVGGDGAKNLYHDSDIQRLVTDINISSKVMVLFGEAVMYLFFANVLSGKKVTTFENLKQEVESGGAYYAGTNIEQDGNVITGYDDRSIDEVSKAVVRSLGWAEKT